MGTTVLHKSISLDGFVAGPDVSVEHPMGIGGERLHRWLFADDGARDPADDAIAAATFAEVGAVLVGRRTFDVGRPQWEDVPYPVPTFVLTHRAQPPLDQANGTFTFVTDGVDAAVAAAREAAGDRNVIVMGGQTGGELLRRGLLDEIQVNLVPVVLGDGVRLFDGIGPGAYELERLMVVETPAATHMRFRVVHGEPSESAERANEAVR